MSNTPPARVVNAALPPVLEPVNSVVPPKLVMTVALPAVLVSANDRRPRVLVRTALPAELEFRNSIELVILLLVMVALPAVLVSKNDTAPKEPLLIVALSPLLWFWKLTKPVLAIVALPRPPCSPKLIRPALLMMALAAVLVPLKPMTPELALLITALPAELGPMKLREMRLSMVTLPALITMPAPLNSSALPPRVKV
jgi:hypothetical protein